jgi:predicted phosphate transport protein (TIGR00153 family)
MPKQQKLFEHFERMADLAHESSGVLRQILENLRSPQELLVRIEKLEQQGDDVHHEALKQIQKGVSSPFESNEALRLLEELDDVIDGCDVAAHRLVLYKVHALKPEAVAIAQLLQTACAEMSKAVKSLRTAKNAEGVLVHVVEVNRVEDESDRILRQAIGALFEHEKDAIEIIKWKEILEILEQAVDGCEHVANAIERTVVRSSAGM